MLCPAPWSHGGYTWIIPAKWRIKGSAEEHDMKNGWRQDHKIYPNGIVELRKFGRVVQRTVNNVYEHE
jgi:hypothetical protein